MAKFYIREWSGISGYSGGMQCPAGLLRQQTVLDFGSGVQQSAAFGADCVLVEWSTDAICSWTIGNNPTATTSNQRYPADSYGFFAASPGQKLSVISNT